VSIWSGKARKRDVRPRPISHTVGCAAEPDAGFGCLSGRLFSFVAAVSGFGGQAGWCDSAGCWSELAVWPFCPALPKLAFSLLNDFLMKDVQSPCQPHRRACAYRLCIISCVQHLCTVRNAEVFDTADEHEGRLVVQCMRFRRASALFPIRGKQAKAHPGAVDLQRNRRLALPSQQSWGVTLY